MDSHHRDIIRRNRGNIADNVHHGIEVVEQLFQREILTDGMKEEIECAETSKKQIRKLLDIIPKRGQNAFAELCVSLYETKNFDAARFLDPEESYKPSSPEPPSYQRSQSREISSSQPSEDTQSYHQSQETSSSQPSQDMQSQVLVITQQPEEQEAPETYRGLVVIINNVDNKNKGGRDCDFARVDELFRKLHFEVKNFKNKPVLKSISSLKQQEYSSFILLIMSSEPESKAYENNEIGSVWDYFFNEEWLRGKPKVIILQNHSKDEAELIKEKSCDEVEAEPIDVLSKQMKQLDLEELKENTAFLTSVPKPGSSSWKPADSGSWFIQALVETIRGEKIGLAGIVEKVRSQIAHEADVSYKSCLTTDFNFQIADHPRPDEVGGGDCCPPSQIGKIISKGVQPC